MQKRTNDKFDQVVNKGIIMTRFRGPVESSKMMLLAGLPTSVILRILTTPQKIRISDWR